MSSISFTALARMIGWDEAFRHLQNGYPTPVHRSAGHRQKRRRKLQRQNNGKARRN